MKVITLVAIAMAMACFNATAAAVAQPGYGELKARIAHTHLRFLIGECLPNPKLCGLTPEEHQLLSKRATGEFFDPGEIEVQFHSEQKANDHYRGFHTGQEAYSISSRLLYDTQNVAKPYHEIARLIFVGLYQAFSGRDAEALSQKVFSPWLVREKELPLEKAGQSIYSIEAQSKISPERQAFLFLNRGNGALDVTSYLAAATRCPESARLLGILGLEVKAPVVLGHMVWMCEGKKHQAQFRFDTYMLRASIFNELDCEGKLI